MSVSTSFPDANYTSANKPSVETLKADISALEVAHNAHENGSEVHGATGNLVGLTTLQSYVPAGVIFDYVGASAPSGFLLCDGSAVSRNAYSTLYGVIGTTYGAGDESTTFNLPDFRGKVSVMKSTDEEFDTLGETGGAKTHTLTGAESGTSAHGHAITDPGHTHTVTGNTSGGSGGIRIDAGNVFTDPTNTNTTGITVDDSSAADASEAHNNLQPYLVANKIIKV